MSADSDAGIRIQFGIVLADRTVFIRCIDSDIGMSVYRFYRVMIRCRSGNERFFSGLIVPYMPFESNTFSIVSRIVDIQCHRRTGLYQIVMLAEVHAEPVIYLERHVGHVHDAVAVCDVAAVIGAPFSSCYMQRIRSLSGQNVSVGVVPLIGQAFEILFVSIGFNPQVDAVSVIHDQTVTTEGQT